MNWAQVWPWALGASVFVILTLMGIVIIVLRAAHSKVPMVPASSVPPGAPGAAAGATGPDTNGAGMLALQRSFLRGQRKINQLTPRASLRSATPWILSIGETGSGKSAVFDALKLSRVEEQAEGPQGIGEAPCIWHLFERGVVLDVSGSLILDRDSGRNDERTWKTLLGLLNRNRPERPLDAVVLSISSADLVGPQRLTEDAINMKASKLEARLTELQQSLSLRLPVYIMVTKCDRIPGFTGFVRSLPPERRQQMLGWSSPYAPDTAFSPTYIDEAMGVVSRGVQDAEFTVFASGEELIDPDEMVLLPPRLMAMAPALRAMLERLFQPTSYDLGPTLRGIYLTGDAERPAPLADTSVALADAPADDFAQAAAPVPTPVAVLPPQRAFVADLFNDKIFAERGLARPGPRVFPSRNRRIAALQIGTAAILVFGPFALWGAASGVKLGPYQASNGVRLDMADLEPLLKDIDAADTAMMNSGDAKSNVHVFPVLNAMAGVSSSHFGSLFLPTSLVSPLHGQVEKAIQTSFEQVLFPEFEDALQERMRHVLDQVAVNGGVPAVPTKRSNASLPQYLSDLRLLAENIERYNRVTGSGAGTTRDLATLVEYLYGEEVSPGFFQNDRYYRDALKNATGNSIRPSARDQSRALERASQLVELSYTAVSSRLTGPRIENEAETGLLANRADVQAVVGLRAFLDTAGPVEKALSRIGPPFQFGNSLASEVRDSLTVYRERLTGDLATKFGSATRPNDATLRALDALLRQGFMRAATGRVVAGFIPNGTEPRFDLARLDEAIAMHDAYTAFLAHGLDSLPDGLRGAVRRLASVQVGAAMANAIAEAVAMAPVMVGAHQESVRELKARVATFEQSGSRVSRLLDIFDELGATAELDSLETLTTRHAARTLARLDTVIDLGGRYTIAPNVLAGWNGQSPFSAVPLGQRDMTFSDFLAGEEDAMRSAAPMARPLVVFLDAHTAPDDRSARAVRSWTEVLDALDRLDRKPATGPLAMLDHRLPAELDSIDVRTCLKRPLRAFSGGDLLSRRIDDLRRAVWRRCADVAGGNARATYARLEDSFRRRIAGHFPFSSNPMADEVPMPDLVAFLHDYDALGPNAADVIAAAGANGSAISNFLSDIDGVRRFLAPLIDSAARPLTYDYQVNFRVNRSQEVAANQIADWSMDVGTQHAVIGGADAARRGRWRAGDTVSVTLRWATGSPLVPADVAGPGVSIHDGTVNISLGGAWGLIRLLRGYEADATDGEPGATIAIVARTSRRLVPSESNTASRAYMRLRLYSPDSKAELRLPHFPVTAPGLSGVR